MFCRKILIHLTNYKHIFLYTMEKYCKFTTIKYKLYDS